MALRGAISASIAWWVAHLLPAPASDYPYYAPLGAVIATTTSLAGSVRESLQAVAAVALGGSVALAANVVGTPTSPIAVAVVVAVGVLLAGWWRLGSMGSWVPSAALFTAVIGRGEAFYVGAYAGLVLLGALIGVVVNTIAPPLPLAPAQRAVATVRRRLVERLASLTAALRKDEPPGEEEWADHLQQRLSPARWEMRNAVQAADEARRGNTRAHRHRAELDDLDRQADVLDRIALLLADLSDLLSTDERDDLEHVALGPRLRPAAADVLEHLTRVVRRSPDVDDDDDEVRETRAALTEFIALVDQSRTDAPGGGTMAAGTLAVTIRRCLDDLVAVRDEKR